MRGPADRPRLSLTVIWLGSRRSWRWQLMSVGRHRPHGWVPTIAKVDANPVDGQPSALTDQPAGDWNATPFPECDVVPGSNGSPPQVSDRATSPTATATAATTAPATV